MKLRRAAAHRRMPWKNGGGETLEVAISPEGAATGDFDWRVSMAVVAADGPFSIFPGIDRTLVLLEGEGMMLDIAGRAPIPLTVESAPCSFPGDAVTSATLAGGPITDLNVMTARGRYNHLVERLTGPRTLRAGSLDTVLLFGDGTTVGDIMLDGRDVVSLDAGEAVRVAPAAGASCLAIAIRPVG